MEDKRVSAEEIKQALAGDIDELAKKLADAMNAAQAGRIIADSEEPVRDAHAEFRRCAFEKALSLLQNKQEAFSPSACRTKEQGQTVDDASDNQRANRSS